MTLAEQVLTITVAAVGLVYPYARAYVVAHITSTRLAHVRDIARIAVRGAEKLGNDLAPLAAASGLNVSTGKEQLAAEAIVSGAKRFGLKLTDSEVLVILHEALREMEQLAGPQGVAAAA